MTATPPPMTVQPTTVAYPGCTEGSNPSEVDRTHEFAVDLRLKHLLTTSVDSSRGSGHEVSPTYIKTGATTRRKVALSTSTKEIKRRLAPLAPSARPQNPNTPRPFTKGSVAHLRKQLGALGIKTRTLLSKEAYREMRKHEMRGDHRRRAEVSGGRASAWQRDLTTEGIEPNPGPPLGRTSVRRQSMILARLPESLPGHSSTHDQRVLRLLRAVAATTYPFTPLHLREQGAMTLISPRGPSPPLSAAIIAVGRPDLVELYPEQFTDDTTQLQLGELTGWLRDLTREGVEPNPGPPADEQSELRAAGVVRVLQHNILFCKEVGCTKKHWHPFVARRQKKPANQGEQREPKKDAALRLALKKTRSRFQKCTSECPGGPHVHPLTSDFVGEEGAALDHKYALTVAHLAKLASSTTAEEMAKWSEFACDFCASCSKTLTSEDGCDCAGPGIHGADSFEEKNPWHYKGVEYEKFSNLQTYMGYGWAPASREELLRYHDPALFIATSDGIGNLGSDHKALKRRDVTFWVKGGGCEALPRLRPVEEESVQEEAAEFVNEWVLLDPEDEELYSDARVSVRCNRCKKFEGTRWKEVWEESEYLCRKCAVCNECNVQCYGQACGLFEGDDGTPCRVVVCELCDAEGEEKEESARNERDRIRQEEIFRAESEARRSRRKQKISRSGSEPRLGNLPEGGELRSNARSEMTNGSPVGVSQSPPEGPLNPLELDGGELRINARPEMADGSPDGASQAPPSGDPSEPLNLPGSNGGELHVSARLAIADGSPDGASQAPPSRSFLSAEPPGEKDREHRSSESPRSSSPERDGKAEAARPQEEVDLWSDEPVEPAQPPPQADSGSIEVDDQLPDSPPSGHRPLATAFDAGLTRLRQMRSSSQYLATISEKLLSAQMSSLDRVPSLGIVSRERPETKTAGTQTGVSPALRSLNTYLAMPPDAARLELGTAYWDRRPLVPGPVKNVVVDEADITDLYNAIVDARMSEKLVAEAELALRWKRVLEHEVESAELAAFQKHRNERLLRRFVLSELQRIRPQLVAGEEDLLTSMDPVDGSVAIAKILRNPRPPPAPVSPTDPPVESVPVVEPEPIPIGSASVPPDLTMLKGEVTWEGEVRVALDTGGFVLLSCTPEPPPPAQKQIGKFLRVVVDGMKVDLQMDPSTKSKMPGHLGCIPLHIYVSQLLESFARQNPDNPPSIRSTTFGQLSGCIKTLSGQVVHAPVIHQAQYSRNPRIDADKLNKAWVQWLDPQSRGVLGVDIARPVAPPGAVVILGAGPIAPAPPITLGFLPKLGLVKMFMGAPVFGLAERILVPIFLNDKQFKTTERKKYWRTLGQALHDTFIRWGEEVELSMWHRNLNAVGLQNEGLVSEVMQRGRRTFFGSIMRPVTDTKHEAILSALGYRHMKMELVSPIALVIFKIDANGDAKAVSGRGDANLNYSGEVTRIFTASGIKALLTMAFWMQADEVLMSSGAFLQCHRAILDARANRSIPQGKSQPQEPLNSHAPITRPGSSGRDRK